MNFTFFVSRRYLFSRKSHNAINIVTGISVACVAVVTAALIIIVSAEGTSVLSVIKAFSSAIFTGRGYMHQVSPFVVN